MTRGLTPAPLERLVTVSLGLAGTIAAAPIGGPPSPVHGVRRERASERDRGRGAAIVGDELERARSAGDASWIDHAV